MKFTHTGFWAGAALLALLATKGLAVEPVPKLFEAQEPHMGTLFTLSFYAPDLEAAKAASREAFDRIEQLNGIFSDYQETTEVRWLVRQPVDTPVWVSPDLFDVLTRSKRLSEATGGAFDVTVGPLIRHWRRARRHHELPAPEDLAAARPSVGHDKLRLGADGRTVTLLAPDMFIDFGGIAKGYAADQALEVLRTHGITRALVAASGDLRMGDPPPGEPGWLVGVGSIDAKGDALTETILLSNAAVSTSGDTEQFVLIDGIRYSHIVDPKTGIGLTERIGVTVVAPNATTSDSYATAVSVLGAGPGMKFIEDHPGVETLIIELTESGKRRSDSSGFGKFIVAADGNGKSVPLQ